jgi:hypothetical protein
MLMHIFSFLNAPTLCRVARVNQRWNKLANSQSLWEPLARQFSPELSPAEQALSWKRLFQKHYLEKKKSQKKSANPIAAKLNFELLGLALSGLKVTYVRVVERSRYSATLWPRTATLVDECYDCGFKAE